MIAQTLAGDGNPGNAFKIWVGVNDETNTQDTSTDVKSYTATTDVSTNGSITGISLAGTVYPFDPVLDGDNVASLTAAIEAAIVSAGYSYENGDVRVSKTGTEVTISVWPSALVFTLVQGATANVNFTAANSEKINVTFDNFNNLGYRKK